MTSAHALGPGFSPGVHPVDLVGAELRLAVVTQINAVGLSGVTLSAPSAAAGLDSSLVTGVHPSVGEAIADIAERLIAAQATAVGDTVLRRRSLTESIKAALWAYWQVVEEQIDEHRAVLIVTLAGPSSGTLASVGPAVREGFLTSIEGWLGAVADVHRSEWQLPVRQLAQLTLTSLDGLTIDYVSTRDSAAAHDLLTLLAYHLAQHAYHQHKGQRHRPG